MSQRSPEPDDERSAKQPPSKQHTDETRKPSNRRAAFETLDEENPLICRGCD